MTVDRRKVLQGLVAAGALAAMPGWASAATSGARPLTIPALREWRPRSGGFRLASPARILLAPAHAGVLKPDAEVFAEELRALLGIAAQVVVTSAKPKAGEVALRLGAEDTQLGEEGYRLDLGSAAVITANRSAGVFFGTRTLLQLLPQGFSLPAGTARDWPRYPERGLMVDIGRKHFSYEWLEERIYELAFLKFNFLHLHFTEDLGWRIESDRTPPVHSEKHLTKSQVADLVELAARHHLTVTPEVDLPGHMTAALTNYPQFQLKDVFGRANPAKLDYTIEAARTFARELVEEYLPLFPGPNWHTGADEYLGSHEWILYPQLEAYAKERYGSDAIAKDGVLGLINDVNEWVGGKTLRVAHDNVLRGKAVQVDRDVVVEWWTDFSPLDPVPGSMPMPQELLDARHQIANISWYPTYYSNLPPYYPLQHPDLEGFYETWSVNRFHGALFLNGDVGTPYHDIDPREPNNLGSRLSVWCDDPEKETEDEIAAGIRPRLRIMSQQTWESPKLVPTYAEFEEVIRRVGRPH